MFLEKKIWECLHDLRISTVFWNMKQKNPKKLTKLFYIKYSNSVYQKTLLRESIANQWLVICNTYYQERVNIKEYVKNSHNKKT